MKLSEVIIEQETTSSVTIAKESWIRIEREILEHEKRMTRDDLRKFSGSILLKEDPLVFQRNIRDEW